MNELLTLQFYVGMAVGGLIAVWAILATHAHEPPRGHRGYTPPNAGRPILPQGGSGTAPPKRIHPEG